MKILICLIISSSFYSCNILKSISNSETNIDDNFYDRHSSENNISDACHVNESCDYWFDTSATSTLFQGDDCTNAVTTDSQDVRCIVNQAGGSNIFRVGGFPGTYNATAEAVDITGSSNKYMLLDIDPGFNQTWFLVIQLNSINPPSDRYIFGHAASGPSKISGLKLNSSNKLILAWGDTISSPSTTTINSSQKYLVTIAVNGTSYDFKINQFVEDTKSILGSFESTLEMTFAAFYSGSITNGADIRLHEFVMYNQALPNSDIESVENFLKNKWGI